MGNIRPAQIAEKYEAPDIPNEERRALCARLTEQGLSPQWSEAVAWADMLPPLGMFRRLALIGRMIRAEFSAEQIHEAIQHTGWPGDIEDTLAMVRAARPFAEHPALLGYQERYFVLKDFGGKCRVCWFDEDGRFRHQSPAEFKLAEANEKIQVGTTKDGVPVMASAAKVWFEHRHRRQYDRARFAPGEPQTLDGGNTINLWRGWPVPLVETQEQATGFMGHIFHHVCGGDNHVWNWLLSWLADAVQNVHRTAGTAIVLRGPQGSGKNFFVERIMELFAPHAITLTRSEQMTGNFNAHLMDKTMVFANEAFFAGSNKDKNALKALVTDGTMLVEPKGVDAFPAQKRFRVIMASNENWVINVEGGDRRYLVLDVDAGPRNNDRPYFRDLARRWDDGEREAFFAMLATRNLSNWDEGAIPETAAKTDQRELSLGDEEAWVQEMLEGGELPSVGWFTDDSAFVASAELPTRSKKMGAAMRLMGAQDMIRKKRRGWWVPSLGTARARFAEATGLRPDWRDHSHAAWGHVRGRAGTDPVDLGASQEDIPF